MDRSAEYKRESRGTKGIGEIIVKVSFYFKKIGNMDWSLIGAIVMGAISGYVASRLLGGEGYGFIGNIFLGILGGVIGKYLVRLMDVQMINGFMGEMICSILGAIILIAGLRLIPTDRKSRKR